MTLPPHFIDTKNKEVIFHLKGGYPVKIAIATWMKSFPENTKVFLVDVKKPFTR
tara:strand:- start:1929 stop:2090 length:162 start_codon:yes stop_codon:yes gene_type:complete